MIDIEKLTESYEVRKLNENDIDAVRKICLSNPQFYLYTEARPEYEDIRRDMLESCPEGKHLSDKYYVGFFDHGSMTAVMDLIDGYPDDSTAFIGFFMMDGSLQGKGTGSAIIRDTLDYLGRSGFVRVRLCINKGNPQSEHFWLRNGFEIIREIDREDGTVYLAERRLI